MNFKLFCNFNS